MKPLFENTHTHTHSVVMSKHSMEKVKKGVKFLNPGQTSIFAANQPLLVLAEQIPWEWPDKFIVRFGGLCVKIDGFKIMADIA